MAWEGPQHRIPGLVAGADLSGAQYRFVKLSASKTVVACAAVTDKPIGILQNDPLQGQEATVASAGVSKLVGSAALGFGASVGTSADGRGAAYTAVDTTKYIVGQVIQPTAAANEIAVVDIECRAARTLA